MRSFPAPALTVRQSILKVGGVEGRGRCASIPGAAAHPGRLPPILRRAPHVRGPYPQSHAARTGREDHHRQRQAERTGESNRAVHRGRWHRSRHLARQRAGHGRRGRARLRRPAPHSLAGSLRRGESQQAVQHLAAGRDGGSVPRIPGVHQGTAHDSRRRRHPLAQRGVAADAGPVRVPSPVKHPETVDMVIFRENTEDIYAGIEFEAGTPDNRKFLELFRAAFPKAYAKIRFPESSGIGIKPVSKDGSERLIRSAIQYCVANSRKSLTLVHKGNIQKFTEGAFRNWGYQLAEREFGAQTYTWEQWERTKAAKGEKDANAEMDAARKAARIIVKDAIADITLQQVLTRPEEFDVIATLNLNGDYLSDALAAQVGGIGIAPGGNINYLTGHAVFEATHGTAPKYANLDKVNPGSVILSGEMMFRYLRWPEAADAVIGAIARTIGEKIVTYDFARLMEGAREVSTSAFADALIRNL